MRVTLFLHTDSAEEVLEDLYINFEVLGSQKHMLLFAEHLKSKEKKEAELQVLRPVHRTFSHSCPLR